MTDCTNETKMIILRLNKVYWEIVNCKIEKKNEQDAEKDIVNN